MEIYEYWISMSVCKLLFSQFFYTNFCANFVHHFCCFLHRILAFIKPILYIEFAYTNFLHQFLHKFFDFLTPNFSFPMFCTNFLQNFFTQFLCFDTDFLLFYTDFLTSFFFLFFNQFFFIFFYTHFLSRNFKILCKKYNYF